MALLGNSSVLSKHPGRDVGGGSIGLGQNRGDVDKSTLFRGRFTHDGWEPKSGVPDGARPPAAWVLPLSAGALSARNLLVGSGSLTSSGARGLNGTAALQGTGSLSGTGALIVSAVAALTGSGTIAANLLAVLNAEAALVGSGALASAATALGAAAAALTGTGTVSPVPSAVGHMQAAITPFTELSPESLAAAVWASVLSQLSTDGTTGYALRIVAAVARNRVVTDPAAGTYTVFDDDNTALLSGDLWENAAGTVAYSGSGAERRDRLT